MAIDPQLEKYLKAVRSSRGKDIADMSPQAARAFYRDYAPTVDLQGLPIGKVEDRDIGAADSDIKIRIYTPVAAGSDSLPVLVFFHGGGWIMGDLDTYDPLCRSLANGSGYKVISVDYRLAPEHPFPAAVDDCFAAVKWVEANASEIGIDPTRIAVGGDSAGGNLAAVVCQLAKAAKGPHIIFQLLVYPITDIDVDTGSYTEFADGFGLQRSSMVACLNHYAANIDNSEWRLAPLRNTDLAGLPSAYIVTAGYDILRDEGRAYAEALKAAGVAVEYVNYDGMVHGFFTMQGKLEVARDAVSAAAGALKEALA